ncbi:hypothetical protein [Bernardetia sp.]|uniref:hypothetical protein n=1 Tax=Bernardetia sp. TaxID=1937974 RepID=UPI0025BF2BA8|nr:hypothetical protein [Bernardetia sp.]
MYFELSQLDRAFYDYLRRRLVENGYLPDISTLSESDYKAQMMSMTTNQKVVEIFGVGSVQARGRVDVNKIVIDRIDLSPADIGAWGTVRYQKNETAYNKYKRPPATYNVTYQIGFVTDSTREERKLLNLILSTFGAMGCKNGIKEDFTKTENYFDYKQVDFKDNSDGDYFEKIFRYQVSNVFITPDSLESDSIGTLKQIDIETINEQDNE